MQEPSGEIRRRSDRLRKSSEQISPSSTDFYAASSDLSALDLTLGDDKQPPDTSFSTRSISARDRDFSEHPSNNEISAASSQTLKGAKADGTPAGKDKKKDKSTVECLNLVSKACFRKVHPSSFYLFFRPRSLKAEFSYSAASVDKDVSKPFIQPREGTQKGILLDKDFDMHKEPTQGKTVKMVGFGMGNDLPEPGKVKSDISLGVSLKSEQKSVAESETTTRKKLKKGIKKLKKGAAIDKTLQVTSEGTIEGSVLSPVSDESSDAKTTGEKKSKILLSSRASLVDDKDITTTDKVVVKKKKKKTPKGMKTKKLKNVAIPEEVIPSIVSGEAAPLPEDELEHTLEDDQHPVKLKLSDENTLTVKGSFDVVGTHDASKTAEVDGMKGWKSGHLTDALLEPPTLGSSRIAHSTSGSRDSVDSSSSSSSSDSAKSKQLDTKVGEVKEEVAVTNGTEPPKALQREPTCEVPSSTALRAAPSFMLAGSFDPTASFMGGPMLFGALPLSSQSYSNLTMEEHPDVLQAVSSCTIQLIETYNALVDDKSDERWAPIKELMTVMSYDELTRRRESRIEEDIEEDLKDERSEIQNDDILTSPVEVHEDPSSLLLASNVTASSGKSALSQKQSQLMPDNFSEKEFMKYFCSDWEQPTYSASKKSDPKDVVSPREEVFKTVSEAIDKIDPDATYDVVFTYKMPKSSPFDLNDSLADVRFKCVQKWMNDTVNATYRLYYDSEIKRKAEENLIKQLMEKMVALQLEIREYEDLLQKQPTHSLPTESSKSSFIVDQSIADKSEDGEEEEQEERSQDTLEHLSDGRIESEIGILMSKLEQLRAEDSEVKEKRIEDSVDTSATEHSDKTSQSRQSIASSGSGTRRVTTETRGKKRRKEIREQLEKVIGMLEKKMNKLKNKIKPPHFEAVSKQGNEELGEVEPQQLAARPSTNQQDEQNSLDQQQLLLRDIEAKLKRDFLIGVESKKKGKNTEKSFPESRKSSRTRNVIDMPTHRQRLQLYLLGLTDTWYKEEEEASSVGFEVKEERLLGSLKKEDIQAGIKHIKHQKRHIKYLPSEQHKAKMKPVANDEDPTIKQLAAGNSQKTACSEQSKNAKNRTVLDPHAQIPFTCNCLCDRVSKFNVKRKEHFRTVLSENLWCLKSDPQVIIGNEPGSKQPLQDTRAKTLCPPEEIDEANNFRGWLADTDRNLLLLFNRSPLDRLNKDYYGQPHKEKHQPLPEMEKEDSKTIPKNRMEEALKKISTQEAQKFWVQVEKWYEDYKKCDKTRQLIEEFEKIDINAMMKRDLSMLQKETDEKLMAEKMKIKLHMELVYRKTFFENLKKLRDEYECSMRNRIAAKEMEMEAKKAFTVQSTLRDMKDKFGPIKEEHRKRCIAWMAQIRDSTNATSHTVKQRQARKLALMVDKMDVAERTRKKLVAASGKEHEEMEKTLGKAVEEREVVIEELDRKIVNLTRDVGIWKRAVREVLNSFKKFMYYILETRPDRAQYFLSLERLYQIQMDDMIREASEELKKFETSEVTVPGKDVELQPTMEIKCPSHDIRYPSERSTITGSSSDTDIDKDTRNVKVADHAVDAVIKAVLPTPEMSVEGEDEDRIKELEELIGRFVNEDSELKAGRTDIAEEVCEEETVEKPVRGLLVEDTSDAEIPVEEFTRRRIRDLLQIISRRKPQIKGHIHL